MDGVGGSRHSGRQGHAGAIIDGPCCHSGAHSTTRSMTRRRRGRVGPSSWPLLSLLLAALLALQPCGAPPINPGQNEELKLPIVRDTVKLNLGSSDSKDYRGSALCRLGDLDGNGVEDMALGAYGDDTTATDAGAVILMYMQKDVDAPVISWRKITSGLGGFNIRLQAMDYFGASLAGIGDVDGDGMEDMVVGALGDDEAALNAGAIYLLCLQRGDAAQPVREAVKITGGKGGFDATMTQNSYFGSSVAYLGDVDGNGVGDIAVGAYGEDRLAGVVYILFLQNSATTPVLGWYRVHAKTPGFQFSLSPNDAFGVSVAGLGDVDGDGVPDMAVGAYMDKDFQPGGGAVYILLLQPLGVPVRGVVSGLSPVRAAVKIGPGQRGFGDTSLQRNAYFGASLAGFKDVDGDGIPELMVGTIGDGRANPKAGAVHLLYLGLNTTGDLLPSVKDWRKITTGLEGFKSQLPANTNFGAAIAELPDLSGDGQTEIAVGCYVASNASIYLLYKNSLTAMAQSRPQIYSVSPPLLDTMGGQTVTMALLIDSTVVDLARPYALEVVIGTFRCTDPSLRPYDGAAKATVTAMIGPQGNIVASPPASSKADAAAGAIGAVPFPTMLPPETTQQPFLLTCASSAGVGSHLPAQATISQGGAEVPLMMAKAASYATPVVLSIAATGSAAKGGFDVRVTGKNFGARDFQPMVLLQETPCMATLWESDTSVVCQGAPPGLGTVQVKVSVAGQTSVAVPTAEITYDAPVLLGWNITHPKFVSLPVFGGFTADLYFSPSTVGKEEMQIWGKNFGPPGALARVAIGSNSSGLLLECTDAVVVSDGLITCLTPTGYGANHSLAVSVGGLHARLDESFSYGAPLLVTIVPETASTDGGELVIMGRNFGQDAELLEVRIGDEVCREVKMVYENQLLTCEYPAGGGQDLPMTVSVGGQTNTPPRAFSYADTYGQRTVEAVFLLAGERFEKFGAEKQSVFAQVLFRALYNDPALFVTDDAVHITNVTSPITGASSSPAAAAPRATQLASSDELHDVFASMNLDEQGDAAAASTAMADGGVTADAENMAGGRRRSPASWEAMVLVAVDIAAPNAKAAGSIQSWLHSKSHQARLLTYLNSKDTGLHVLELQVVATAVTTELYCPPGHQQQSISSNGGEKACFACPVGTYQPLRSKASCQRCPFGADCPRQGIDYPVPMPGFWRQPLPPNDAPKIDPYFTKYRIYACNPPDVCLGGLYSNCTDGHQQGSPLCAICEESFYAAGGVCKACGPKRTIQITVCFAIGLAMAAFFLLLYFFVRPGNDIDEAADAVKEELMEGPKGRAFTRELSMSYFLSNTLSRHLASRISDMTRLPDLWSKAKISITFFQILASLNVAYSVPWPAEFLRLLHKLDVLNLNLLNIPGMAYACVHPMDYFAEFFLAAFFPVVLTLVFVVLHALGVRVIRRKVRANIDVVRSLEAQSLQMKNQLIRKMRLISVRMLRKRRPLRPPTKQPQALAAPPPPAAVATTYAASEPNTSAPTPPAAAAAAAATAFAAAFPPIQEDTTLAFSPQPAFQPPTSPTPVGQLEHQASTASSASTAASEPVLDAQGSAMYQYGSSQASSPDASPKRTRAASPPVLLPMPSQGSSRFGPSPPLPSRGTSPPPPIAHVTSSSPPRPARSSPPPIPIPTTGFAAVVAPEPSPATRSAVIDIFSPRMSPPPQQQPAAVAIGAFGVSSLTSDRTARLSDGTSQASGGAGGVSSTSSGGTASSQPRVRKKATFSDRVMAAVAGEQAAATTMLGPLQPSESLGKDESLGGRSGVTTTTGAGSLAGVFESAGEEDEEDGESIVAIKHKLALLEKQQDVEQFSIERYTSRLATFWFWIILFIYPAVSRVVLEAVNCRTLDNGRRFLRTDFTVDCQSQYYLNHLPIIAPAILLYPVGIPLMFFLLLKFKRDVHPWDENLAFLYKAYRREYWWFEIYELLRKLFLTGLIIFIAAGTATQVAIACIVCAVTMCLHMRLRPYEQRGDDVLQGFALAEVLLITYCALLLKLDLSGSDAVSVRIFDVILIGTNAVVVLGIMPASFYFQSRQYIRRFLSTMSLSLSAMMKRELAHRVLVTLFLLLALWASLANSVYDPLTATITGSCLLMLVQSLPTALYFFGPINDRLPARYRIVAVLAPRDCAPEGAEGGEEDGVGNEKEMFASTMSILKGSGGDFGKGHLAKLNARKLEAIHAAGLSTAELERPHRSRSSNPYGGRRRNESDGAADGDSSSYSRRPSLTGPQRSSIDSSFAMDGSLSSEAGVAGGGGGGGGQAPDRSWLGWLVLVPWTALVRHRRLFDPVMAVLTVDLAVMCADGGKGNANYARLVMLAVAALLTMGLCAFPHVKDGHPPRVSPLRIAQCLFALSAVNVLLVSFQNTQRLRRAVPSASAYDLALVALASALVVAALCALHATAGIVRGLRATAPGCYSGMGDGRQTAPAAAAARSSAGAGEARERALSHKDSVFGGPRKARIYKDLVLLLAIGLVVAGLVLTHPKRHGRVVPICMMVGLGLLFSFKPLRALREAEQEFVGQLVLLHILVCAFWPRHGRGRQGRKGSYGGRGGESEHADMFDERDLSAATRPEALAAEVIRLRRKVAALEERLEEPAEGDGGQQG